MTAFRGGLQCFSAMLVLLGPVRLAAVDRWLPSTVTTTDRSHCSGEGGMMRGGMRRRCRMYEEEVLER